MIYKALFGINIKDDVINHVLKEFDPLKMVVIGLDYCYCTSINIKPVLNISNKSELTDIVDDLLNDRLKAVPVDSMTVKKALAFFKKGE